MRRIEYLIFKKLGKTDLDVLEDSTDNAPHTYLALGLNTQQWIDELAEGKLVWSPTGSIGTQTTSLEIAGVGTKYPAQELDINIQGGVRGAETKLTKQRHDPLRVWSDPVRKQRPGVDTAFIFLLRDDTGTIHARYVDDGATLPDELINRIRATGRQYAAINFSEEGGVVLENALLARIIETLRSRHNVILYGPPGTGKTWLMTEVDRVFHEGITPIMFDPKDLSTPFKPGDSHNIADRSNTYSEFVIFHQSTSYESFVAGLRPRLTSKRELRYDIEKGPFFDLAEHALEDDSASLLLVDEINRGNTAEILGELITVLEPDKRLAPDGSVVEYKTVTPRLPYAPEKSAAVDDGRLLMPFFFYTLASMNSVDRTVAPLDSALRRRFQIIEVTPDLSLIRQRAAAMREAFALEEQSEWDELTWLTHELLRRLNTSIGVLRGPDFQLGHAYFWPVVREDDAPPTLSDRRRRLFAAFADTILPQLREVFRDQPEELFALLGGNVNQQHALFTFHTEPDVFSDLVLEPTGWLEFHPFPIDDIERSLAILRAVARVEPGSPWASPNSEQEAIDGLDTGEGAQDDAEELEAEDS